MLQNQVPMKTAKGLQEIEQRTHGLALHSRQILIMVNGQSTVADLVKKLSTFGDIASVLTELEQNGFIVAKSNTNQDIIPSQRTLRPQSPNASPEFNLEKAKGFIRFVLLSSMGPTAERRVNRIEAATSVEELRVELDAIHEMLPKILSKREAQQAWSQLEPIMVSITKPPV